MDDTARLLAVEVLLADPEALGNDALETDLYILRDQLRGTPLVSPQACKKAAIPVPARRQHQHASIRRAPLRPGLAVMPATTRQGVLDADSAGRRPLPGQPQPRTRVDGTRPDRCRPPASHAPRRAVSARYRG